MDETTDSVSPVSPPADRRLLIGSRLMFGLALLAVPSLCARFLVERASWKDLYRKLSVSLPWATKSLLEVPAWAVVAASAGLCLALILKESRVRDRTIVLLVNAFAVVALVGFFEVYRESMFSPLVWLVDVLDSQPAGKGK